MLVPFGTRVVDKHGKGVGTVSRVILHAHSRQVVGLVVHQGVLNRRQVVVPIGKVSAGGEREIRLTLSASELAGLDLFLAPQLQPMPDHWDMPAGFDQREFFLVGGDGWTEAVLPFVPTSPGASGTPSFEPSTDPAADVEEPIIAAEQEVFDRAGQKVGEVEAVEIDQATGRIVQIVVRRGVLFGGETAVPASMIASADGPITLNADSAGVKKLERLAGG